LSLAKARDIASLMEFNTEILAPVCQQLFDNVVRDLPPEIANRLTCSKSPRVHGSYRTVLLFNVWDKYQSDVLPKQHFCYCLGYDPHHLIGGGTDWYFHLWLNTIRIYRERDVVKATLEKEIASACPKGFRFIANDRAMEAKINFNWQKPLKGLPGFLAPRYVALIKTIHPILIPVIDKYSIYGSRDEVKKEVLKRGRLPFKQMRFTRPELIEEYSRSIPPSWRLDIFNKSGGKCVHCGVGLKLDDFHMDHKIPFTKGGKRVKINFQALCPNCNLKKGNRFIG